jgi:hypothetical protein
MKMFRDLQPDSLTQRLSQPYDSPHPPEVLCFHDTASLSFSDQHRTHRQDSGDRVLPIWLSRGILISTALRPPSCHSDIPSHDDFFHPDLHLLPSLSRAYNAAPRPSFYDENKCSRSGSSDACETTFYGSY